MSHFGPFEEIPSHFPKINGAWRAGPKLNILRLVLQGDSDTVIVATLS